MRILVEPSDYAKLRNVGDIAMQETAVKRISNLFPEADIRVLADFPDALPRYAENAQGLSTDGRRAWMAGMIPERRPLRGMAHRERSLRARHIPAFEAMLGTLARLRSSSRGAALKNFLNATAATDLLVVCGMGGIADEFEKYALDLLDTMDLVLRNTRSVVAMFGQGMGPLASGSRVFRRASEVLPKVDLIGLREARASVPLLERLGVDRSRLLVTGDDALEFAAQSRSGDPGRSVGMNIRLATYANLTARDAARLREPVQQFAAARFAPLQSLPSSMYLEETDFASIRIITEGYSNLPPEEPTDPLSLIACVQRCRIAIVASYHAAIYALAQGVPVIGLYNNAYYRDKFLGLEDLFGSGVFPVHLGDSDWSATLTRQANEAWDQAPALRRTILASVDRQIVCGHAAYQRLREICLERAGPARDGSRRRSSTLV